MVPKAQDYKADALGKAQACLYLTGASCQELKAKQAKYGAIIPVLGRVKIGLCFLQDQPGPQSEKP